jgi:maleylpyruvate isomerase
MRLHGYFRSSTSHRVRIALNLKGVKVEHRFHHLRHGGHRADDYLAINPQGLVPALELDDGRVLTQSMAIIEWLEETHPSPPLLPSDPWQRARIRSFALIAACDIHPLQNLRVLARLRNMGEADPVVQDWANWINAEGLAAMERMLADVKGPFCFGETPTLADVCLIPQLASARRFNVDVAAFPRLLRAEEAANALPAFADAAPARQPDAE